MKNKLLITGILIYVLAACAPAVQAPDSALKARDAVIAYLAQVQPEMKLETADSRWQVRRDTPEKLLGYETYSFRSGKTLISVGCPVVAPWDVICAVKVESGGALWEGRVNAAGEVLPGLE